MNEDVYNLKLRLIKALFIFVCEPPFWKKNSILYELEEFRKYRDDLSLVNLVLGPFSKFQSCESFGETETRKMTPRPVLRSRILAANKYIVCTTY